jgi:MoaA/NifB/PqqE/SkfB family radical SAM enzyme
MKRLTLLTNPDRCNLCCPLCFLNQRGRAFGMGEMPIEVARAAIERFAGAEIPAQERLREVIPSTMGEPLLYTYFDELLDFCRSRQLPMNLTTNGTFPGKWGTESGMVGLLDACSDIKVSCMAFDDATFDEMMPGFSFERWRDNVCRLAGLGRGSVTLQVTVHKNLVAKVPEILAWAESIGIARIKWNLPVFISGGQALRVRYGVDAATVRELREFLPSRGQCEGSLFFDGDFGSSCVKAGHACEFFSDEIWILPDGTEEFCPNPERRFGDRNAAGATCGSCVLLKPIA